MTPARAAAGSSRPPREDAAPPTVVAEKFDIGAEQPVLSLGADSWGLVGRVVHVPHLFWDIADGATAECNVAAFIGAHAQG